MGIGIGFIHGSGVILDTTGSGDHEKNQMRIIKSKFIQFLIGACVLVALCAGAVVWKKDAWLKDRAEEFCRTDLGMDLSIGSMKVGILDPVVNVASMEVKNPPEFGDRPLLHMKEMQLEYDLKRLRENKIRLPKLKLDLQELNIVKNEVGQINITGFKDLMKHELITNGEYEFESIDRLELTLRKVQYIDMSAPDSPRSLDLEINSEIFENVSDAGEITQFIMTRVFKQLFTAALGGG